MRVAAAVTRAMRSRKRAFYKRKFASSKSSMWNYANGLRAIAASPPSNPTFGDKLNDQFSDKVWQGIPKPDLSRYLTSQGTRHPDYPKTASGRDFKLFGTAPPTSQSSLPK
jgi:hypothetical protein